MTGLIVDLFAGGGGASLGIERAMGRHVNVAINHSAVAIAAHERNHPLTRHFREDVWRVSPAQVCMGHRVVLLWASPACTHFSRAKGGTNPRSAKIRSLAWVVIRWAREVRPDVIMLENVEEFAQWGPLDNEGKPNTQKVGLTFRHWLGKLRALGYVIEYRSLVAADYGTPTTRKRLFLIARCDGKPIVWPHATHAKEPSLFARQWRSAAECIDFTIPCPSIFTRKKPLAEATCRRIAAGVVRYVIDAPNPFLVSLTHQGGDRVYSLSDPLKTVTCANRGEIGLVSPHVVTMRGTPDGAIASSASGVFEPLRTITAGGIHHAMVAASLIQSGYGEREGQAARALDIQAPLGTVVSGAVKHALVAACVTKHYGGPRQTAGAQTAGAHAADPLGTVTTVDHHALTLAALSGGEDRSEQVRAFLAEYQPKAKATLRAGGWLWAISDIGMRMLAPRELFAAQGFPSNYNVTGMTKTQQVALCGNSVCPQVAEAIVRANMGAS